MVAERQAPRGQLVAQLDRLALHPIGRERRAPDDGRFPAPALARCAGHLCSGKIGSCSTGGTTGPSNPVTHDRLNLRTGPMRRACSPPELSTTVAAFACDVRLAM